MGLQKVHKLVKEIIRQASSSEQKLMWAMPFNEQQDQGPGSSPRKWKVKGYDPKRRDISAIKSFGEADLSVGEESFFG